MPVVVVGPGPGRAAVRAVDRPAAGRAPPAGTARTLLGGWNPDETYWLTDILTPAAPARAWHNHDRTPPG
jgi:hypothetical protein